ncbi:MAG: thiamine phosphate synthase [Parachlamydia sp.]|nr:thiamine phosphate synthase [Parachlamydia sp.]
MQPGIGSLAHTVHLRFHVPLYPSNARKPKTPKPVNLSLYLVADKPSYPDERLFFSKIKSAVRGGVSCIQLRDYRSNRNSIIQTAKRLKEIIPDIPLFINTPDSFDIAQAVEATGVFIEDAFAAKAKEILEANFFVGVSVRTGSDLLHAAKISAIDYISVKVSRSRRCPQNDHLWGIKGLELIRKISSHRIVAIGGLCAKSSEAIYQVLDSNDGIAMGGGLMDVDNPYLVAQEIIRNKFKR